MKLAEIRAQGGIVSAEPVAKEVTWKRADGEEFAFTVFVRRQSFGTIEAVFFKGDDKRSKSARLIAASILFDGAEPITYEDAYQLDPTLAGALIGAINEVNGTGADAPKN